MNDRNNCGKDDYMTMSIPSWWGACGGPDCGLLTYPPPGQKSCRLPTICSHKSWTRTAATHSSLSLVCPRRTHAETPCPNHNQLCVHCLRHYCRPHIIYGVRLHHGPGCFLHQKTPQPMVPALAAVNVAKLNLIQPSCLSLSPF